MRTIKRYWQQLLVAIYNLAIFGRLQNFAASIPTTSNEILHSTPAQGILSFVGIRDVSIITNFINSIPWVWLITSMVLTMFLVIARKVTKFVVVAGIIVVGFILIYR
ncbi:MAG: hypothetical protein LBV67_02725 [Streptococcaceae bacterium]|nr:hypothetical protein [Streptococcaceae bacterium]